MISGELAARDAEQHARQHEVKQRERRDADRVA